jgi:hypothetical protein
MIVGFAIMVSSKNLHSDGRKENPFGGTPPANVVGVSTTATLIFCVGGNDGTEVRHRQTMVEH